jgi:hypothetical protein
MRPGINSSTPTPLNGTYEYANSFVIPFFQDARGALSFVVKYDYKCNIALSNLQIMQIDLVMARISNKKTNSDLIPIMYIPLAL